MNGPFQLSTHPENDPGHWLSENEFLSASTQLPMNTLIALKSKLAAVLGSTKNLYPGNPAEISVLNVASR